MHEPEESERRDADGRIDGRDQKRGQSTGTGEKP